MISHIIDEVCQKEGIQYKSCNPNYVNFASDAALLGQLYKDLLDIEVKLIEIADRNDIPALKELIIFDVEQIKLVDHDLIRLANKFLKEKK